MNTYPDTLTGDLTSQDIHNGKRCDAGFCPYALAVHRLIPDADKVTVNQAAIRVYEYDRNGWPDLKAIYLTRPDSGRWISRFDSRKQVKAHTFTLDRSYPPVEDPS